MQQEFTLQKRPFNEPASFQDLLDEAMENDLIEYIEAHEESVVYNEYKENFKKWICQKIKQSDISIELFKMYFVYANFRQFILEINQPDYDNTPFRSPYVLPFDTVFNDALYFKLIVPENDMHKAALYSTYDYAFTEWLSQNLNIKTQEEYNKQCTLENFKELLKKEREEQEEALQKYEQEKIKHQRDIGKIPQPVQNVSAVLDKSTDTEKPNPDISIKTFETIISKQEQDYILKMLEDLNITSNGKSCIGTKKFSSIRALVDIGLEKNIFPKMPIHSLCLIVAAKINLPLVAVLKTNTNTYREYVESIKVYIKANPIK